MFPHSCGADLADAVQRGANPQGVVPDGFVIVHGGSDPLPPTGVTFSGSSGPTLEAAAAAVPHGQIRVSSAGAVRAQAGVVEWEPELSRYGTLNQQHVNITEGGPTTFSPPQPNPVTRQHRIDGTRKKARP